MSSTRQFSSTLYATYVACRLSLAGIHSRTDSSMHSSVVYPSSSLSRALGILRNLMESNLHSSPHRCPRVPSPGGDLKGKSHRWRLNYKHQWNKPTLFVLLRNHAQPQGHRIQMVVRPELGNPRKQLSRVCWQVESQFVQEQHEWRVHGEQVLFVGPGDQRH